MLVKIYAGEISGTRVRANLLDLGIIRTRLRALALPDCACNGEVVMASAVSLRPNE
jgi:hypothetical protein